MQESDEEPQEAVDPQDMHEAMPAEMKDHMWAAFAHKAGLGPHPGQYQGPDHPGVPDDAITESDLQRAREGEVGASKMHAAQTGGAGPGLGPEEEAQLLAKQQQTLEQRAAVQGQQAAQAAQAQQTSPTPPPAPSGAEGVSQPYPAQAHQPPPAPAPEEQQ
jgi:hypothetical protein